MRQKNQKGKPIKKKKRGQEKKICEKKESGTLLWTMFWGSPEKIPLGLIDTMPKRGKGILGTMVGRWTWT